MSVLVDCLNGKANGGKGSAEDSTFEMVAGAIRVVFVETFGPGGGDSSSTGLEDQGVALAVSVCFYTRGSQ